MDTMWKEAGVADQAGQQRGRYVFWGREGARAPTFPECSQEEENNLFFELIECEIFNKS